MAKVIDLAQFRKERMLANAGLEDAPPPGVSDADIWSRDWSAYDNVLFGLFKVREVLEYYLPYDEAWKHFLLQALDAGYRFRKRPGAGDRGAMKEALAELKGYIAEQTDAINRKDMAVAGLLVDLMQKSPPAMRSMHH